MAFFSIYIFNEWCSVEVLTVVCSCRFIPSQDAHELFHVLTSSLEEERDRQPKVTHLFDMQSLEASCHLPTSLSLKPHTNISSMPMLPVCCAVQFSSFGAHV